MGGADNFKKSLERCLGVCNAWVHLAMVHREIRINFSVKVKITI